MYNGEVGNFGELASLDFSRTVVVRLV